MLGLPTPTLFVVLADPGPDREPELHHWYDAVHGPDALANGSFDALNRYRAVGAGWHEAPFLALWEGRYHSDAEAWEQVGPRARQLRAEGRIGDIPSAVYALMFFHTGVVRTGVGDRTVRSVITVQNDWRDPVSVPDARTWYDRSGLGGVALGNGGVAGAVYLYSSDPSGPAPGRHLAVFESALPPAEAATAWESVGVAATPGMSPTPPFRSAFSDGVHGPVPEDQPPVAGAWAMIWEPIARLG